MEDNAPQDVQEAAQDTQDSMLAGANELGDNEYWLSEGYKAEGERPEWFKADKYNSVADQAKAYVELEKKLGSFTGSPKEGYAAPEGVESEDFLFQQLAEFGKENGMSQKAFDAAWQLLVAQNDVSEQVSVENELKALGPDANQRIQQVDRFLRNSLDADRYNEVKDMVVSAKDVQLVEALISATQPAKLPIDGNIQPGGLTWGDIEKEMFRKDEHGNLLRSVDRNHEMKIQRMMQEFGGDKPYVRTVG